MSGIKVVSSGMGRGRVMHKPVKLRKPGQFETNKTAYITEITDLLNELTISNVDNTLDTIVNKVKGNIQTTDNDVESVVDLVYKFCTQKKENAKIGANLSHRLADFSAENKKFKLCLLRKIQQDYEEREAISAQMDKSVFVQNVHIICELYLHLRLPNGEGLTVLVEPISVYFEMLLQNGSDEEIEAFAEQMHQCWMELKQHKPDAFKRILMKIRTQIISSSSEFIKATLLQLFETILTDNVEMDSQVVEYYDSLLQKE